MLLYYHFAKERRIFMSTPKTSPVASFLQRPLGRTIAIAATAFVVLIVVGISYIWISGGSGKANGTLTTATLPPSASATTFVLGKGTQATYTMTELHFGNPNTVIGKTDQATGEIQLDFTNPTLSRVGQMRVDMSTLQTDSEFRDRATRSQILETDQSQNQFAVFTPSAPTGLPTTPMTAGQTVNFQLPGTLLLHGVTHDVVFAVSVTLTSQTQITGSAKVTVKYADYNISIPSVPSVANVSQDVQLALNFTA